MVRIDIIRDDAMNIRSFKVSGHADFADHGEDIVCSAVSVLAQTSIQGLKMVAGIGIRYEMRDGFVSCRISGELTEKQQIMSTAILETMYIGFVNLKKGYKKHIDLRENEEV